MSWMTPIGELIPYVFGSHITLQ